MQSCIPPYLAFLFSCFSLSLHHSLFHSLFLKLNRSSWTTEARHQHLKEQKESLLNSSAWQQIMTLKLIIPWSRQQQEYQVHEEGPTLIVLLMIMLINLTTITRRCNVSEKSVFLFENNWSLSSLVRETSSKKTWNSRWKLSLSRMSLLFF